MARGVPHRRDPAQPTSAAQPSDTVLPASPNPDPNRLPNDPLSLDAHQDHHDEQDAGGDDGRAGLPAFPATPRSSFKSFLSASSIRHQEPADGRRAVHISDHAANAAAGFRNNALRSAKYTPWNLIPKALYEQFKRISNSYFLLVAAISFIPGVSPTTPIANVLPLLVVVGFGFARDVYEDVRRANSDRKGNNAPQIILARAQDPHQKKKNRSAGVPLATAQNASASSSRSTRDSVLSKLFMKHNLPFELHRKIPSRDIAVGDIVLVTKGEVFPADLVLLKSASEGGVAYVSTANLDGESNLKRHVVATATADVVDVQELASVRGIVRAQKPNLALHKFEGSIRLADSETTFPLDSSNLLLRGSILRNTDYIYGVVVYTGSETKVALNMRNPPSKMGQTERKLNWVVLFLFCNLTVLVIVAAVVSGYVQGRNGRSQWYMGDLGNISGSSATVRGLATFLILFSTYIPVSLFVTLEFVRVVQAVFMQVDWKMKTKGQAVVAKATNLNEVLGQIQFILSDKTGTLTENIMRYVACSAGSVLYDTSKSPRVLKSAVQKHVKPVRDLILAMALCHSVVPEPKDDDGEGTTSGDHFGGSPANGVENGPGEISGDANSTPDPLPEYQGQSPDEVALVSAAREFGVTLVSRSLDMLDLITFGKKESYEMLAELEFNSDRKRMSMILRCPDNSIRMYTKGADTIMMPLLKESAENVTAQEHIDEFAKQGLRTLVFASKSLTEDEFQKWFSDFQDARNLLSGRAEAVAEVSERIEKRLDYIAVTAVEDKLQDRVPETIKFFREAGVGLWVLTGDKRETAENIGYSANLLDRHMNVVHVQATSADELESQLLEAMAKYVKDGVTGAPRVRSMSRDMSRQLKGHEQRTSGTIPPPGTVKEEQPVHVDASGQPTVLRRASSAIGSGLRSLSSAVSLRSDVEQKELAVIIDGASLSFAIESHSELFMDLADRCKTIICCRVTPLQKALVVRMVREMRQALTLAVGDGGNDVSMIQEAHVGVGIYGKEGTQAARAGDYAISEFKHLQRLLSIHGRFSYVRTAGMINLSFYKNIFFTLTQVLFQIYNFDTGTNFHDQWIVSTFNVFVTAAPPFLYGIFERDLEESTVTRFPGAYASNRRARLFSLRTVIEYTLLYGLWHCICVFFGVFFGLGYLTIPFRDGKDGGLFFTGLGASVMVVVIALSKFIMHSHILNWVIILFFVLSFASFFALIPIFISVVKEYPLEGQLAMLFTSPQFYLTCALVVIAAFTIDLVVLVTRQLMFPDVVSRLQRWEQENGYKKDHTP